MRKEFSLSVLVSLVLAAVAPAAETVILDYNGRIIAMMNQGDELALRGYLVAPVKGWTRTPGMAQSERTRAVRGEASPTHSGLIAVEPDKGIRFRQTVTDNDGKAQIDLEVTAESDVDVEGVYYTLDLPRAEFAGGRAELRGGPAPRTFAFPETKPAARDALAGEAESLALADASGRFRVDASFDRPRPVFLDDKWERAGRFYSAVVEMHRGPLAKGASASMRLTLSLTGRPDTAPARVSLDASRKRYRFHGFGGNYCFNIESPVTQYTLKNLRQGWARTEMTPSEWEPENDNDSPSETNWEYLTSHDTPDSNLRREFLLAKQIQDAGIPYAISIWQLPEFLYADPGPKPQRRSRRKIAPDKWDELLESLGSYLLYAKRQYGVEPDLFSFNEANIGVDVLLTPEEHRDAIKRIGAHFRGLGLKTRMLLADATGPRGTHEYALAAAADPEAMQYVAAVAFHSWGGGTPEQYKAWGDLAEWLRLPLLVAELGVDAAAYRGGMYDSFHYGVREVEMYQELLLHARPQGTMQWEFTADYGIVRARRSADGSVDLVPTPRYYFVKQFTNLTPRNSDALATSSDHAKVLLTAFAGESGGNRVLTLHISNTGAARAVTIDGLPAGAGSLRVVRTAEGENYRELPAVKPEGGSVRLEAPARSLVTLTTMPPE